MKAIWLGAPLVLCGALLAQEFDVATIKPTDPNTFAKSFRYPTPGGGLQTLGSTLKDLIVIAYDVLPDRIQGGPPWTAVDRYDVTAKTLTEAGGDPATLTHAERQKATELTRLRTRALLASRFNLAIHKETREFALFELHVDKNGPKADGLKESTSTPGGSFLGNVFVAKGNDMRDLSIMLASLLKEPVIDKTGLTGGYDFTLRWSPDELSAVPRTSTGDADKLPSIFTALREQLGLRLDRARGPLEVIVIDNADRPSAN